MTLIVHTVPVQPSASVPFFKGIAMNTNLNLTSETNRLLPAECQALTACMGKLLGVLGKLLQEQPEPGAGLSPETGRFLVKIGEKVVRAGQAGS